MTKQQPRLPLTALCLSLVSAPAPATSDYVHSHDGSLVVSSNGACVAHGHTDTGQTHPTCNPAPVAASVPEPTPPPVAIAPPAPAPAPRATTRRSLNLAADTLFSFDRAELTEAGRAALDAALAETDGAQALRLRVAGHTDAIGPDDYNQGLSERRAQAVADYLSAQGLDPARIQVVGYGETRPRVDCPDQTGAALIACLAPNRRTEVEFAGFEVVPTD